jgi:O-antigen/teichoic acid export membrane protein
MSNLPVDMASGGAADGGGAAGPSVHDVRAVRRGLYVRAVWSGAAVRVVNIATQMLMVSLTVRYLGKERYGVWTMVNTLVAWFTLANLGLGNGLMARLAGLQDARHVEAARTAAFSALTIIAVVSVGFAAPVMWVVGGVPWARLLNVTSVDAARDVLPTVLTGIGIIVTMLPLTLAPAILIGHQRSDLSNVTSICGAVVGLALLLVGVRLEAGMPVLFAAVMLPQMAALFVQLQNAWGLWFSWGGPPVY